MSEAKRCIKCGSPPRLILRGDGLSRYRCPIQRCSNEGKRCASIGAARHSWNVIQTTRGKESPCETSKKKPAL